MSRLNKTELRKKAISFRKKLSKKEKAEKDYSVFEKVIALEQYKNADTVLLYASTEYEVDTVMLTKYSFENGKKVAFPICFDKIGNMSFKFVMSTNELKKGMYGILEPPSTNETFIKSKNAICIVPSLLVDKKGYRLGYGKGYYDRFLKEFNGFKCILCYKEGIVDFLPKDMFDIKCDVLITD